MRCPQCHTENKSGRKFCAACGQALALACPACGFVNDPGDRFCGGCGQDLTAIPPPELRRPPRTTRPEEQPATAATSSPITPHPPDAERRHLTVMFCDLVDSTPLSEQLDPEDLREVVRAYQQTCAEVIQRFEGHIAQYLGDGLLVYFGYPQAHDDDAQRAVQAGLNILAAMETLNTRLARDKGLRLAVRAGIHTGLVVVGEMGGGGRQERLALGDTPNMAARIQGLAAPDTVLISAATQRLVQGYFAMAALGPQALKGIAAPVPVYRILGASEAQNRLDVAAATGLTPLVGRESEVVLRPAHTWSLTSPSGRDLGDTLFHLGEFVPARAHLERGLALYSPQQHRAHAVLYGQDLGMGCRIFAALTLWVLGYPDQALHWGHEALTLARALSHPFSLTYALTRAARLHGFRGEWQTAQERAEALIALARAQGFAQALATGQVQWGCALAAQGQGEEGITQIRQGLDASRATGAELMRPFFLTLLAEAYGRESQLEEGLRVLAEAIAAASNFGERWYEAERHRLKGELLLVLAAEHDTEAQSCFRQALAIARHQQAKSWELRAAMSPSRLWQRQGKRDEARQLLAPIYGWFTEGFDTADLQEAKVLLNELL